MNDKEIEEFLVEQIRNEPEPIQWFELEERARARGITPTELSRVFTTRIESKAKLSWRSDSWPSGVKRIGWEMQEDGGLMA